MRDTPLTVSDASKILGISAAGVRAIAERGGLSFEKTPSGYRIFRMSDVEKLARQRKSKA